MISKPISVIPSGNTKIEILYADGTNGIVDLSPMLNKGIFQALKDDVVFQQVYIDQETFSISWNDQLQLCPDSLYLKIKGMTFEEWQENRMTHASN